MSELQGPLAKLRGRDRQTEQLDLWQVRAVVVNGRRSYQQPKWADAQPVLIGGLLQP